MISKYNDISWFHLFFPLMMGLGYFIFTFLVFLFGPWDWKEVNIAQITLIVCIVCAIFAGYCFGIGQRGRHGKVVDVLVLEKTYTLSILLMAVMAIGLLIVRTGGEYMLLIDGLINPGYAYGHSRENVIDAGTLLGGLCEYCNIIISPFTILWLPIGMKIWKYLSKIKKICFYFGIFFFLMPYIATGTNKGLFDVSFWAFWVWVALNYQKINLKILLKFRVLLILGIISTMLFLFFSIGIAGRYGGDIPLFNARSGIEYNIDHPLVRYIPDSMQGGIAAGIFYITHGYKGMAYCMDYDWVPMYGIGHSRFYTWLLGEKIFQVEHLSQEGYCYRLASSGTWDDRVLWSSVFPWIANDVGFWGIPVVMFIFAFFCAICWKDIIEANNTQALCVFPLFMTIFFTLNMNNYIFQAADTALLFIVLFFYWLYCRYR